MSGGPWFVFMVLKMIAVFCAGMSARMLWEWDGQNFTSKEMSAWGWTLFWVAFAVIMRIVQWAIL